MKEKNKWDQPDLDIVLFKTLRRQILLAEEDLPRNFDLREEKVYPYFWVYQVRMPIFLIILIDNNSS